MEVLILLYTVIQCYHRNNHICLFFYTLGAPCKNIFDESHQDWAPTIFPRLPQSKHSVDRIERKRKREEHKAAGHDSTLSSGRDSTFSSGYDSTFTDSGLVDLTLQLDSSIQESASQV